ncbi:MAG: universal stress protein [Verrucomicrobiota bacterium]|nr:universal stress protein [Verrucomicrobiota bacterium]
MIKNLLLCSDGSEHSKIAMETALQIAHKFDAKIHALNVIESRDVGGSFFADLSGAVGIVPYQNLYSQLNELFTERGKAILAVIEQACEEDKVPFVSLLKTGDLAEVVQEEEKNIDLVIIGRNGEHLKLKDDFLGKSVERVIRISTKPCLITADRPRQFSKAVIAFDGSENSRRAFHAGMEFVRKMEMQTTIISVDDGHTAKSQEALAWASAHAAELGIKTECKLLTGNPEEKILDFAHDSEVDIIIMGAYGHNRIREFIIGSVTSSILFRSTIPVLLGNNHHD